MQLEHSEKGEDRDGRKKNTMSSLIIQYTIVVSAGDSYVKSSGEEIV